MLSERQKIEDDLSDAVDAIDKGMTSIRRALLACFRLKQLKPIYQTPQWHHTVLWTGFAFITGMLLGAGLMAV